MTTENLKPINAMVSEGITEGKHFLKGITINHTLANAQPHQVFWTKHCKAA